MTTQDVLDRHLAAFAAGDADAVAANYTDDAIVINQNAVVTGRDAIRENYARVFSGPFAPGTYTFTLDLTRVDGEVAYITWHAECATIDIVFGTDTFVIRDGKIAAQTYGIKVQPHA
jgi:uncharacterized protein (TIGR02246 family)